MCLLIFYVCEYPSHVLQCITMLIVITVKPVVKAGPSLDVVLL